MITIYAAFTVQFTFFYINHFHITIYQVLEPHRSDEDCSTQYHILNFQAFQLLICIKSDKIHNPRSNIRFHQNWKQQKKRERNNTSPNLGPQASLSAQYTQESHKQGPSSPPHMPLQAMQHSSEEFTLNWEPHFTASPQSSKCLIPLQHSPSSWPPSSTIFEAEETIAMLLGLWKIIERQT